MALVGFVTTGQAAKCPRCASELLSGKVSGFEGVVNLFRLSAGSVIPCRGCDYEIRGVDYT